MKKIKLKIKNSGFVILFAVTLAAILLSIALGVSNVALREIKFGTSAKDTNEAFFAADTGAECALVNDKSTSHSFVSTGSTGNIQCLGNTITLNGSSPVWSFNISGLGAGNNPQGCATVTVNKTNPTTVVTSKGYNNSGCNTNSSTAVERQLEVRY